MAGLYDGIEEASFKPVAGGYVFTSANPWLFGARRHYFVNEAEKAALAACIKETLRRLKPLVKVALFVLPTVVGALLVWFGLHDQLNAATWSLSVGGLLAPYVIFVHVYTMIRQRPLLAQLPRTPLRITASDARANLSVHMPQKLLVLLVGCFGVMFLASVAEIVVAIHEHGRPSTFAISGAAVFLTGRSLFKLGRTAIRRGRAARVD